MTLADQQTIDAIERYLAEKAQGSSKERQRAKWAATKRLQRQKQRCGS